MKKILSIAVCLLLLTVTAVAQTETEPYKTAAQNFEQKYNAGDNDGIFALFNPDMQQALPIDQTRAFLTSLKKENGNIVKRQFDGFERGSYAVYKTTFSRSLLALRISVDNTGKINGMFIGPYTNHSLPKPERNTAKLSLPFQGEWTVFWGGDTKEQNYHVESEAQKNAFDLVITDQKGSSHKGSGNKNEDYYAFGKPIQAPCEGTVVLVVDGVKDNRPGEMNPVYVPGNTVVVKIGENQYAFFAHFKQHSIVVKQGQKVTRGNLLGLCGNTGNSSEPHLHFHLQNIEDMSAATGVKCYFEKLRVNGQLKTDYSPVKDEKISNP